jgi:hypothetical protein
MCVCSSKERREYRTMSKCVHEKEKSKKDANIDRPSKKKKLPSSGTFFFHVSLCCIVGLSRPVEEFFMCVCVCVCVCLLPLLPQGGRIITAEQRQSQMSS